MAREEQGMTRVATRCAKPLTASVGKPKLQDFAFVDDVLRREQHNETVSILICGTKNDRSVRYSLGRSTSPMAVAAYTYDKLPAAEQQALPNEGHLVAALPWATRSTWATPNTRRGSPK